MNVIEANQVWQQLHAEGRVGAQPPAADTSQATPWPVRLLAGVGAWIATPLLLGFIGLLFGDWLLKSATATVLGVLLCAGSLPWLRRPASDFLQQMATVVSVAGLLLIGLGLAAGLELSDRSVALALAVLAAVLYALSQVWVHRFVCAGIGVGAGLWWLAGGFDSVRLEWLLCLAAWAAAGLWLLIVSADPRWRMSEFLRPLAWATSLVALGLAVFGPLLGTAGATSTDTQLATTAVLPVVAAGLLWPQRQHSSPARLLLLLVAALALAWLWRWAPGVSLALALVLLAFALAAPLLLALAVVALSVFLAGYYYQLGDSLLAKSQALGLAGGLLLAVHMLLRRWPARRSS